MIREIAYAVSGDKGEDANIGVIAYDAKDFPLLEKRLTAELVAKHFQSLDPKEVIRYELPNLLALNFILKGVLSPLKTDSQGKTLGQAILEIEL